MPFGFQPVGQGPRAAANDPTVQWYLSLPADQRNTIDQIGNGFLQKDANGNWYNPKASGGVNAFLEKALPIISMAGTAAAFAPAVAGMLGAGGVAPVTEASLAAPTDGLLASNVAPAAIADTLPEITVTAPSLAGAGAGAGAAATTAAALAPLAASYALPASTATPDIPQGSGVPKIQPNNGFSRYLPKNLVSNQLTSLGASPTVANAAGGAVQGAGISALLGGNPLVGAAGGALGGGIGGGAGVAANLLTNSLLGGYGKRPGAPAAAATFGFGAPTASAQSLPAARVAGASGPMDMLARQMAGLGGSAPMTLGPSALARFPAPHGSLQQTGQPFGFGGAPSTGGGITAQLLSQINGMANQPPSSPTMGVGPQIPRMWAQSAPSFSMTNAPGQATPQVMNYLTSALTGAG